MTRIFSKGPAAFFALAAVSVVAACSSDSGPEGQIPDGPLIPTIYLKFAATDAGGLSESENVCKIHGKTAKLDKVEQEAGKAINVYKCQ